MWNICKGEGNSFVVTISSLPGQRSKQASSNYFRGYIYFGF
jgi:hypothetical protein